MLLERILERNRAWVRERGAQPLPAVEPRELAVVACYDPSLDDLLLPALGLAPGEAFLFRSAGALVQAEGATRRSLALAVYMFGVEEIGVVGHSSCRMANFDAVAFIEAFRRRGVSREAFGPDDLRAWAGAMPSPRRGVELSVASILAAPFLPRDLTVWGAVLDDGNGLLEVVVPPGQAPALEAAPAMEISAPPAAVAAAGPAAATARPGRPPEGPLGPARRPTVRTAHEMRGATGRAKAAAEAGASMRPGSTPERQVDAGTGKPPSAAGGSPAAAAGVTAASLRGASSPPPAVAARTAAAFGGGAPPREADPLLAAAETFAQAVRSRAQWRDEVEELRARLRRESNPVAKFQLVEGFARRLGVEVEGVLSAFEGFKREALGGGHRLDAPALLKVLERLALKL